MADLPEMNPAFHDIPDPIAVGNSSPWAAQYESAYMPSIWDQIGSFTTGLANTAEGVFDSLTGIKMAQQEYQAVGKPVPMTEAQKMMFLLGGAIVLVLLLK